MKELHPNLSRILISQEVIQDRVRELAAQISVDYAGVERLCLVGVLKGAFIFLADLARQLTVPHTVDFIAVSSYGKTAVSGAVRLIMDVRQPVEGLHVIIVEDIVDTGRTLTYLHHTLQGREPASLRTCVLTRKRPDSSVKRFSKSFLEVPIDYLGFEIPDVWVVGYGLDYADTYRTLPFIAELKQEAYQKRP